MQQIEMSPSYPVGAEYAKLTTSGKIQAFYKMTEVRFSDSTTEMRLYYISDFKHWQPSAYSLEDLLSQKDGFEVVRIV